MAFYKGTGTALRDGWTRHTLHPMRGYLFDLDGTLFRGNTPIPSAVKKVQELHRAGAIVRYVTNNSTQTREHFAAKLQGMGYPCEPAEVVSSGYGTGLFLANEGLKTAYVVGEPGLVATLAEHGIESTGDQNPDAVVVGLCRQFTYDLMREAMFRIRAGARFVATNPDATYPVEGGGLIPGAGSVVAAIQTCSETEPFVVGKPNPFLIQAALQEAGLAPEEALVVGDRLDTDIESGRSAGCPTFLVLTGVAASIPPGQQGGEDLSSLPW
ncbi:HAD-IIA family hydrolase [Fimbriimonas ginsengisoli]|uniref:NagD protein n=1 Tax=Fimbriimonas ginsengisoli Gsoil 348 TaxID=661478 RepID=A0A068NR82_FIMGI|nr:HAD-IIA family hydrolase [Fimbriimonas ginsengisoli]AIE85275.1 NagD protein [Fimbriimonas ginsengisoli Gsoil 348]